MGKFTQVLSAQAHSNGYLIGVQTQSRCFYGFIIYDDETPTYLFPDKNIYGGFDFTNWKSALSAGIKSAKLLPAKTTQTKQHGKG